MKHPGPSEPHDCNDCGAAPGTRHVDRCDVARCAYTGIQEVTCEFSSALNRRSHGHKCTPDVWSGRWPGEAECEEYDLWCYFVPNGNPSWRTCDRDHPEAVPDLSRLQLEYVWDQVQQKRVPRATFEESRGRP